MDTLEMTISFKLVIVALFGVFISSFVFHAETRTVPFPQHDSSILIPKDTIRNRSYSDYGDMKINGDVEFAGIIVNSLEMTGASANMKIEKPSASNGQWTTSSIIIENGDDQLEAGWTVNTNIYPDGQPRLYAHWKSASSPGCHNIDCPGFVGLNPNIGLGYVFPQISKPTGERYEVKITIQKIQGDWYLEMNDDVIGFWDGSIFQNLGESANVIRFGGQAFSPNKIGPQMGSGTFKNDNPVRTAYMQNVQVLAGTFINPPNYVVFESRCYMVGFHDYGLLT